MENAKRLDLNTRLRVFKHKLTEARLNLPSDVDLKFDLIVSNPPYVPTKDLLKLEPEIKIYEDLRALDGGKDGLNVIRILLKLAGEYLENNGHLWLEVDSRHPEIIEKLIETQPELGLKFVSSYKDIFQKNRFVEIIKQ